MCHKENEDKLILMLSGIEHEIFWKVISPDRQKQIAIRRAVAAKPLNPDGLMRYR